MRLKYFFSWRETTSRLKEKTEIYERNLRERTHNWTNSKMTAQLTRDELLCTKTGANVEGRPWTSRIWPSHDWTRWEWGAWIVVILYDNSQAFLVLVVLIWGDYCPLPVLNLTTDTPTAPRAIRTKAAAAAVQVNLKLKKWILSFLVKQFYLTGPRKNWNICKISGEKFFFTAYFVHNFAVKCGEIL